MWHILTHNVHAMQLWRQARQQPTAFHAEARHSSRHATSSHRASGNLISSSIWPNLHGAEGTEAGEELRSRALPWLHSRGGASCACHPSMVLLPWQQVKCSPKLRVPYQQAQPTLTGGSRCAELLGAPPATQDRQSGAMYSLRGQPASPRISSRAGVCSLGHTGRQAGRQAGRRQAGRQVMPPSDLRGTKGMRRQSRQAPLPNDKHRTILKYITCTVS